METWANWFETADRKVAVDWVSEETRVSTVFLGLDHNHAFDLSNPILWETMIFGGPLDGTMRRYETRAEAARGHAELVARAKLRLVN